MIRKTYILLLSGAVILACALVAGALPGAAAPLAQETPAPATPATQATPTVSNLSISDEYCLSCHGQPGQTLTLEDGSTLDLYVDPQVHASSVHGSAGYACVQCHTNVGEYPHPTFTATDLRDVTLQLNNVCQRCHASQHELAMDSVHAKARAEGDRAAAVCTDCHTAHAVQDWVDNTTGKTLPEARNRIPETCAQCHNAIYQEYLTSVHGSALTEENNPDVPTCIDCHGVHNIEDPTTAQFRLASPQMCAKCHTDPAIMSKYGISTNVLSTYVADFHGTTVAIFEKQSPDAETNKPVCYDCHGVHNIQRADDPQKGLQVQENLLVTCQKCHPNAQDNFPTAWLSHYIPSPDKYPLVYYVNLFYKFFIPTVLGGMSILVVMDVSRLMINKRRQTKKIVPMEPEAQVKPVEETVAEIEAEPQSEEQPVQEVPPEPDLEVQTTQEELSPEEAVPDTQKPDLADQSTNEPTDEAYEDKAPDSTDQPGEEAANG
jgi:hypothetical protein